MKVIINLGQGDIEHGCSNIVVQLLRDRSYIRQFSGSLPAAPKLAQLYRQWQQSYRTFYQDKALRIGLLQTEGMRYSAASFKKICQQIPRELNLWLSSEGFAGIEQALRTDLQKNEPIQVVITAAQPQLQQLPWQFWQFIEDYPLAEVSFNVLNWQETKSTRTRNSQVRILAILGNSAGIDLQQDLTILQALPDSELTILTEPPLTQLNEYLWQTEGWDILLFSGHSHSDTEAGYIYLNQTESITISQLKHSLQKAIARGLQIAIFNSCEGTSLAVELADLCLPYTVVMREPVPDKVAQMFLQYFITAFAGGKTFTLAVKEARQKLVGWETEYVCASWLPAIWQNPATGCLTWNHLKPKVLSTTPQLTKKLALMGSFTVGTLVLLARSLAWLEPIELKAYDRLMQQRPGESIDPRILVVEITEEDTNRDRYPLSDTALVEAVDLLEQHQPAAIGLDLHRSYDRGTGYQELIQRIEQNNHLFPVCAYGSTNKSYAPPKGLSTEKIHQQMGFSDLLVDWQNRSSVSNLSTYQAQHEKNPQVRRQLLSYDPAFAATLLKCLTPYSLSFQLGYEYLQQRGTEPLTVTPEQQWQFGEVTLQQMSARFAGYQQLDGKSSQIAINYRAGKAGKKITLTQLRSGNVEPEWIKDRIILLGYTAMVAQDHFDTPYGIMPGVWIHAHMTSQILSAVEDGRPLIWALPTWGDWLWVLVWSLITGAVLARLADKPILWSIIVVIGMIIALDHIFLLLLIRGGWLPYVPTILSLLLITCGVILVRQKPFSNYRLLKV